MTLVPHIRLQFVKPSVIPLVVLLGVQLAVPLTRAWAQATPARAATPIGNESRVNTTTGGVQEMPIDIAEGVASDTTGTTVIAWTSDGQDGDGLGVFVRLLDSNGAPLTGEIPVNTTTAQSQQAPAVTMRADGRFVVAWESNLQDGSGWGVYARVFDSSGAPLSAEILVPVTTLSDQRRPSVVMVPAGFVVSWDGNGVDDFSGIFARQFDMSGAPLGGDFRINSSMNQTQSHGQIAADSLGNFCVAWESRDGGSSIGISGQLFDNTTAPLGGQFQINTTRSNDQLRPRIGMDRDGNFVVVWTSQNQDGSGWGIYGQRYDATGTPQGGEFRINESTANDQMEPDVTMGAEGNFIVAWSSNLQDGGGNGVYAREFDTLAIPLGGEFRVNTTIVDSQSRANLALSDIGRFFVAWSGNGPGDTDGIFGQLYTATAQGSNRSTVTLIDSLDTLSPSSVISTTPSVALQIGINNLDPLGVTLATTSSIEFSDSVHTYTATLANATYIPPGARNFTITFNNTPLPAGMSAPASYDLVLTLLGADDYLRAYADTLYTGGRNSLDVDAPAIEVTSLALQVQSVLPGERQAPLLALDFASAYPSVRLLDTIVVTNATGGTGGQADLDADVEQLYLYDDVDSTRSFTPADTLLGQTGFAAGRATFDVTATFAVPPNGHRALIVLADIDSVRARDPDVIDATVSSPVDITFRDTTTVAPTFSPLYPLDSFGWLSVDGMAAHQIGFFVTPVDTLFGGANDVWILSFSLPSNGYEPDTLTGLSIKNAATDFSPSDVDRLHLWLDDGDGIFGSLADTPLGDMVFSGDRYQISGLREPTGSARYHVCMDVAGGATNGNEFLSSIPVGGVDVLSANDGPVDEARVSTRALPFQNAEVISVRSRTLSVDTANPGSRDQAFLSFSVLNNTLQTVRLDTLRIGNISTGGGTQAQLDGNFSRLRLFEDDGNGTLDRWDPLVADGLSFAAGVAIVGGVALDIQAAQERHFFVAADIDSQCAADGDSLAVAILSAGDLVFDLAFPIAGSFPLRTPGFVSIDGSMSFQYLIHPRPDTTVVNAGSDRLVLDAEIATNGYAVDTLVALSIENFGTATSEHFARLALYEDGGDESFDGGAGDDTYVGDLVEDPGGNGRRYHITGLNRATPGNCTPLRLFVAADISADYSVAGTIQLGVPIAGAEYSSGNDGPLDLPVIDPGFQVIPQPNRLTVFPYSVGDQSTTPGTPRQLNYGVGFYNGYGYPLELHRLKLYQVGTASSSDIDSVFAYSDADGDGLFDPDNDALVGAIGSSATAHLFDDIGLSLESQKVSYIFVCYSTPLQTTDGVTIDFTMLDVDGLGIDPPGTDIQGEFPINSPGIDVTDGMIADQIILTPTPFFRAGPNNNDVLAMAVWIPPNGIWPDVLDVVTVRNVGSAVDGLDINGVGVWKEAGGLANKFDPASDLRVGSLSWNGLVWANSAGLNEPIPTSGLKVYVTFDVAPAPTDGATVQLQIPVGGIEVESGNDGPIDHPVTNVSQQTLSTDALITSLETDDISYAVGETVTVSMMARNEGIDTLYSVVPSGITLTGSGGLTLLSGPTPPAMPLLPGDRGTFTWTYSADTAGTIEFCGHAMTADSTDSSLNTCTETVVIQWRAPNLGVSLTNTAPATVNRAQRDNRLIDLVLQHPSTDTLMSSIQFRGVDLAIEDGAGGPLAPNIVLERITLTSSSGTGQAFAVGDSATSPLRLRLASPVVVEPGENARIEVRFDVAGDAVLVPFRAALATETAINAVDANDGSALSIASPDGFPWSTSLIGINEPAESLLVSSSNGTLRLANAGQQNVSIFSIDLLNSGSPATAGEILTGLTWAFFDTSGAPVAPDDVVSGVRIRAGNQDLFQSEVLLTAENSLTTMLSTPLILSPGIANTIDLIVDLRALSGVDGFFVTLAGPHAVTARDINNGERVSIGAAALATSDFPFYSDQIVFQTAASGVLATYTNTAPSVVLPSDHGIHVMDLTLSHADAGSSSAVRLDSFALAFHGPDGVPVNADDYFAAVLVTHEGDTATAISSLASAGAVVECRLATPIVINPGATETVSVLADAKGTFTPLRVDARIEQQHIVVLDVNDGQRVFDVAGQFPFVAGPMDLQLPSSQLHIGMLSTFPGNVRIRQKAVRAFDLILRNNNGLGSTPIALRSLRLECEGPTGTSISPATLLGSTSIDLDGQWIDASVSANDVTFSFPAGLVRLRPQDEDTLSVWVDMQATTSNINFRFVVENATAIAAVDAVTGGSIAVATLDGVDYPLRSALTHVLDEGIENGFTNYPNPFAAGTEKTTITYFLRERSHVSMQLYTIWGSPVRTLIAGEVRSPGLYQDVEWDGKNGDGETVNNGVYYLVLRINTESGEKIHMKRKVGVAR